jgi:predicted Zn-dependent peptidase
MRRRPEFKKSVLENGLTLVTERMPAFKGLSMGVWVRTGTRHETEKLAGASHFLEHMLFKGTRKRSAQQIAKEVDQVGGEFNAFTTREHTCFHLLLLKEDYLLGLDILGDILLNSTFKPEELERERGVILQEISMVEDSPEELAFDYYFDQVFGRHSLGRPILGNEKSIRQMKREDLVDFFRMRYRPEEIIISVAGDVSHESIKEGLKPLAAMKWPGRTSMDSSKSPLLWTPESSLPQIQSKRTWFDKDTEQVHVILGVQAPAYASQDRYALSILNTHLGGGMSSVLFQEIREKRGLAYTVYSSLLPFMDTGLFSIYAGTSPDQVTLCAQLIEECMKKVRKQPLKKSELRIAQENVKGSVLLSADCVESRMISIAKNEMYLNEDLSIEKIVERINRVSVNEVHRVSRFLFQDTPSSLIALGPKPSSKLTAKLNLQVVKVSH